MSKRRVGHRTVADGVRSATRRLEEAIAAAVRCPDVTRAELLRIRKTWVSMDELTERLLRRSTRRR